jgi:Fe2+ or Zn2+ uptake regulation protein
MSTRNTVQRNLILESVGELHNHPTAEDVYKKVSMEYPSISKATVYRNLKQLARMGKVKKIESAGLSDHYDHQCHDHYHVLCTTCNKVFDVEMDFLTDLIDRVNDKEGFVIDSHDIMFKGTCPKCRGAQ